MTEEEFDKVAVSKILRFNLFLQLFYHLEN
jgi:hypothetical protein